MDKWRALQQRCQELNAGPCNDKKKNVERRVKEAEERLVLNQTTSVRDLPNEIVLNEIVARLGMRDGLSFCSSNKALRGVCSDVNYWVQRFSSYDYLELQNTIKDWAWTGLMIETLIGVLREIKDRVETATLSRAYLYLREREDPKLEKWSAELPKLKGATEYDNLRFPIFLDRLKPFLEQFKAAEDYDEFSTVEDFIRIVIDLFPSDEVYFSDLIVHSLDLEDVKYLLGNTYYNMVNSIADKKHLSLIHLYRSVLYGALVRSKQIDVLDPFFTQYWFTGYGNRTDLNIARIYSYVNKEEEVRIIAEIERTRSDPGKIELLNAFDSRTRSNRENLLNLEDVIVEHAFILFMRAFRVLSPEEYVTLVGRVAKESATLGIPFDIADINEAVTETAEKQGYGIWAHKVKELTP